MFCWAAPWRGLAFLGNEPSWALLSNGTNSLKRTQEVIENKLIEKALTAPRPATPPMPAKRIPQRGADVDVSVHVFWRGSFG